MGGVGKAVRLGQGAAYSLLNVQLQEGYADAGSLALVPEIGLFLGSGQAWRSRLSLSRETHPGSRAADAWVRRAEVRVGSFNGWDVRASYTRARREESMSLLMSLHF